jgi:hypothetical protein
MHGRALSTQVSSLEGAQEAKASSARHSTVGSTGTGTYLVQILPVRASLRVMSSNIELRFE